MAHTPEIAKMLEVSETSQAIGEFLEWLPSKGLHLAEINPNNALLYLAHININDLLAEYFGIDLNKVEQERRAILEEIRSQ